MAFETGWLQRPMKTVLSPLIHRLWDLDIIGLQNVPTSGPALITPNHMAFIDSVFTTFIMPRRTLAVGKAEYMDSWKTKYIFPATGMIPIDRSGGKASADALEAAAQSLLSGELFLIYPEGTRTRDGYLHKGRTGAARLALRTGAPIIPVGLRGTADIQPIDTTKPKFGLPCEVRIGRPIDVRRFQDKNDDRRLLRQITDEMMFEIAELSGQTYVNVYAGDPLPDSLPPKAPAVEPRAPSDEPRSVEVPSSAVA